MYGFLIERFVTPQFFQYTQVESLRPVLHAAVRLSSGKELTCNGAIGTVVSKVKVGGEYPRLTVALLECSETCYGNHLKVLLGKKMPPIDPASKRLRLPPYRQSDKLVQSFVSSVFTRAANHMLKERRYVGLLMDIAKTATAARSGNKEAVEKLKQVSDEIYALLPTRVRWEPELADIPRLAVYSGSEVSVYELEKPIKAAVVQSAPGGESSIDLSSPACIHAIGLTPRSDATRSMLEPVLEKGRVSEVLRFLIRNLGF